MIYRKTEAVMRTDASLLGTLNKRWGQTYRH